MKERKAYEEPSITVITMDAETDIIQTSTVELKNIGQLSEQVKVDLGDISSLFNNQERMDF